MAHVLKKFYNSFGGLDTRSNKMIVDPKTFRNGSKNFRYNFQDEIQKANGFQHKNPSSFQNVGDIEYKYTDLDTGEAKSELLCIGNDGSLYKQVNHYLKFSSLGTATSYSFYYDDVLNSFIFKLDSYAAITVSEAMTMSQLVTAINALGATASVVNEAGSTVSSTYLAYLIDCVIDLDLEIGIISQANSRSWEKVTYPSNGNINQEVPFITTANFLNNSEYEGVSYQNLNNVVYITDGGFPMKYDGNVVARAGMPKILKPGGSYTGSNLTDRNLSGFSITPSITFGGGLTPNKTYSYVFQHGYKDYNGSEVLGKYELGTTSEYMNTSTLSNIAMNIVHTSMFSDFNFPIFSCIVNGAQNVPDTGATINVNTEHNIKVGMLLRIPISNALVGYPGYSFIMSYVSAVTATTITLDFGATSATLYPFQVSPQSLIGARTSGSATVSGMANAQNGNITLNSKVITSIASTSGILPGDQIFSALSYFPAGTYVVSVDSGTQITASQNATATVAATPLSFNYGSRVSVGSLVTGAGIPGNTTVLTIGSSGSSIGLSANATTNTTGALTFTANPTLLIDGQVLNGGYAQDIYKNKISNPNYDFGWCPEIPFGAFTRVYRSTADGTLLYKLIDLPLDRTFQKTFVDKFSDSELSRIALVDADQGEELPRACKYLTSWQSQLVQAGRPVDTTIKDDPYPTSAFGLAQNIWGYQDTDYFGYIYSEAHLCDFQSIYWADALTPEGFPQDGLHEFIINTTQKDKIKGAAPNKDAIFAFKERSTGVITGSLADNDLNLEILEDDIGCSNHRTIQQVSGALIWLDPLNGFYSCVAGRLPVNIGFSISDYQKINSTDLDYSKALAVNFEKENLYICSVGSTTFVFDYADNDSLKRNCWYLWDRFNVKSMLSTSDDQLLLSDGTITWKMKLTNTKYDFTDHKSAIDCIINTSWYSENSPTIDKQFINLWVNSIQGGFTLDFSQYGNYLEEVISTKTGVSFKAQSSDKKAVKVSFKAALNKLSSISFGMRNNSKNEYVRLQGFEIELSDTYDSGEPKK